MADQIKKFMDVIPAPEDVDAIKLVVVNRQMAQAALQRKDFDADMKPEMMTAYYRAALEIYAKAQHDENQWWKLVNEKYKLPLNGISFDFTVDRFYSMEDVPEKK